MRLLTSLLLTLAVAGCTSTGEATQTPDPVASPTTEPSSSPSIESAEPSPSAEPSATASAADSLEVGDWVETTADRLQLREEPGLSARSMGTLAAGTGATIIEGPVEADGYPWYRLAWPGLPFGSGCATGPMDGGELIGCWGDGWVAGETPEGARYLQVDEPQCPDDPETVGDLAIVQPGIRVACFGDGDLTVLGYMSPLPGGRGCFPGYAIDPGWLHPCAVSYLQGTETEVDGSGPELAVNLDPDAGACDFGGRTPATCPFAPYVGQWVEMVGHFDDPESEDCTVDPDEGNTGAPDDALARYHCREAFVVTSVTAGNAP